MSVPDRSVDVRALCQRHPEAFPHTDQNDAARLVLLRGVIIPTLNARPEDAGNWGYLTKTDQRQNDGTYKVPCDVLVWRPTRETVDCMTGDGACWIVQGVALPAWIWTAVHPEVTPPVVVDQSVSVYYTTETVCPFSVGTIVPQDGGDVVLIDPNGFVVSVQPGGGVEMRPPGTVGSWERAKRVEPRLLEYSGTGLAYYVVVEMR